MNQVQNHLDRIRNASEEIIGFEELEEMLESGEKPVAYEGFEPSGKAHIAVGLYRPLIIQEFIDAGIDFKVLLADYMAGKNGRMEGDPELLEDASKYYEEVLKASKLETENLEIIRQSEIVEDPEYWKIAAEISNKHTENRAKRTLPKEDRDSTNNVFDLLYPSMQCADLFYLEADISQMATDQRKINVLAREVAEDLDRKKPVAVHGKFLPSLKGPEQKMDKSVKNTSIYIHDSEDEINEKIHSAYCPPHLEDNPVMEYCKEIIFRARDSLPIRREKQHGGDIKIDSYKQLEQEYLSGEIHPEDLKNAVSRELNELIQPLREHFETSEEARNAYEIVRNHH